MVEQIASNVWWLRLGHFRPFDQNGYLVDDDGTLTLVDAGMPWDAGKVRASVADAGFELADIDRVLVTHYDLDHFGGLTRLQSELDATVVIGEIDARLGLGEHSPPWLHHKGAFHRILRQFYPFPDDLPLVRVSDGESIGGFVAHHTPGHNPGHTVYVHESMGVGLLGDLVWAVDDGLTPPVWLDSYDMNALYESVRSFADRSVPFEVACIGHGDPLRSGGLEELRKLAASL